MATADKQKTAVSKAAPKPFKRKSADLQHDGALKGMKKKRSNAVSSQTANTRRKGRPLCYTRLPSFAM